jgi:hypothetical protein
MTKPTSMNRCWLHTRHGQQNQADGATRSGTQRRNCFLAPVVGIMHVSKNVFRNQKKERLVGEAYQSAEPIITRAAHADSNSDAAPRQVRQRLTRLLSLLFIFTQKPHWKSTHFSKIVTEMSRITLVDIIFTVKNGPKIVCPPVSRDKVQGNQSHQNLGDRRTAIARCRAVRTGISGKQSESPTIR